MDSKKNNILKKGIFHFHSTISYDGLNSIKGIFRFIKKHNLDFAVLTDHNTIKGSIELAEMVKQNGFKVEIPISAEYKTDKGDVIAINIKNDITNMKWDYFVKEVRLQNGIIILPHPYDGHTDIEELAREVDAIEVFNGRSSIINNFKSYLLAEKYNKTKIWASDAHISFSLKNVIIGFPSKDENFITALLNCNLVPLICRNNSVFDLLLSQIKKGIYFKNLRIILYAFNVTLKTIINNIR